MRVGDLSISESDVAVLRKLCNTIRPESETSDSALRYGTLALIQSSEAHAFKAAPDETSRDIVCRLYDLNAIMPKMLHITPIQPLLGCACAQWHVQDSSNVCVSCRISSSDVTLDSPVLAVRHDGRELQTVYFESIASMLAIDEK